MTSSSSESSARLQQDSQDFSLVHGGPLFQLLLRTHLSSDGMTLVTRRIIAFMLITWLPLLVLSAIDGHFLDGDVSVWRPTSASWWSCRGCWPPS